MAITLASRELLIQTLNSTFAIEICIYKHGLYIKNLMVQFEGYT